MFDGRDITRLPPFQRTRLGIARARNRRIRHEVPAFEIARL